jgi:hypothetical protein
LLEEGTPEETKETHDSYCKYEVCGIVSWILTPDSLVAYLFLPITSAHAIALHSSPSSKIRLERAAADSTSSSASSSSALVWAASTRHRRGLSLSFRGRAFEFQTESFAALPHRCRRLTKPTRTIHSHNLERFDINLIVPLCCRPQGWRVGGELRDHCRGSVKLY